MIGTLGSKIVFEVNDDHVLTFNGMTRDVAGRWAKHEAMGVKPKSEFLGPDTQKISLTINLSASLGVRPRAVLDAVAEMVETGQVEYFVLGNRPVSNHPFSLTGSSEAWDKIYSGGQLVRASMSITLEEYI